MLTLDPTRQDVKQQSRQVRRAERRELSKEFEARQRQRSRILAEELRDAARRAARETTQQELNAQADAAVGRPNGARRDRKDRREGDACCNACGSRVKSGFSRKGFYSRSLGTLMGVLELRVPRIRCRCGGDVRIHYWCFLPYERRFVDVSEQILLYSALCLSVREIRTALEWQGQRLSITTICKEIRSVAELSEEAFGRLESVPPVVQLDGIFLKEAWETGEVFHDKRGRKRKRKKVARIALVVAWGIYPGTGERVLLGWEEGDTEDKQTCLKLLKRLSGLGICWKNGLRLFIHDGGGGFTAAFEEITFGQVEHQRCIFHKMANVLDAVKGEKGASVQEKRERRVQVMTDLMKVWQGRTEEEVQAAAEAFTAAWRDREPEAVAKLCNEFGSTLSYLRVQAEARAKGQEWENRFLRTTSSLERTNRRIREKARKATVFQTSEGLRANVYLGMGCAGKTAPGRLRQWLPRVLDAEHALDQYTEKPCP